MVFIPRDPVMQNQFLVHDSSKGSTATAGAVISLSASEKIEVVSGTNTVPYGFLMQNVKAESSAHPTGFRLPGDLGSSDAFTGDPVGVAHLGLYDTTFYATGGSYTAGDDLFAEAGGKLSASAGSAPFDIVIAVCQNSLTSAQVSAGASLRVKLLI